MSVITFEPDTTGEYETVEDLIRYAARSFAECGIEFRPARMSKLIRREVRIDGVNHAKSLIDRYLGRQLYSREWAGFERYAAQGYRDETGGRAAANVDRERGAL